MGAYNSLDTEQKGVLQALIAYAKKEHRPQVFLEAAVFTAIREDDLRNRPEGDGTSVGWRQEIEGKGTLQQRMDLAYSVPHFYRECAEMYHPGESPDELAYRVQRPAAPYPEAAASLALAQSYLRDAPTAPGDYKFGASPGTITPLVAPSPAVVVRQPDPKDSSPKIEHVGKRMSLYGNQFAGHTAAIRSLLHRTGSHP